MNVTARDLLGMGRDQLDEIFRSSPAGVIPTGPSKGTALVVPGTFVDAVLRRLVRWFVWKGKYFRREGQGNSLKNFISPLAIELFRAEVYTDESWFAAGQAVILDYSNSSFLVRKIRDEIRQVGDGLYLGQVFWGKTRLVLFMLEFPKAVPAQAEAGQAGAGQPA